jgi:hypothetical protein
MLGELNVGDLKKLIKILKIGKIEIMPKDYITADIKDGKYIVNLDNHNGPGTHWTAFIKKDNIIYYFDSFGLPPPINILKINNKMIYYNIYNIQDIEEKSCGYYCLFFIYYMNKYNNNYKKMLDLFVNNTLDNKTILNNFFTRFF